MFQIGKIVEDLRFGHTRGKVVEDIVCGYPHPADAGLSATLTVLDGDPIRIVHEVSLRRRLLLGYLRMRNAPIGPERRSIATVPCGRTVASAWRCAGAAPEVSMLSRERAAALRCGARHDALSLADRVEAPQPAAH